MKITIEMIPRIAGEIIEKAHARTSNHAVVITLTGDLGAGKTTLTQEIARQLSVKENVISPTFVVMKKYKVTDQVFFHLIHIDAYRLEKSEELEKLGWKDIVADATNLIIVEWPEHVPHCIPDDAYAITLSHDGDNTRTITY